MRYDPMIARLYHPEEISHDVTKLDESLLAIFFFKIYDPLVLCNIFFKGTLIC